MAKPNYQFEKRQRDIAKKKKQDEKRSKKLVKDETAPVEGAEGDSAAPSDQPAAPVDAAAAN